MTRVSRERALFLGVFALGVAVAWPLIVPIGAGGVLAYVSEGPIDWVTRKLGPRGQKLRWLTSAVFIALVLATFLLPMTLAGFSAVKQVYAFLSHADFDQVAALPRKWLNWAAWTLSSYGIEVPVEQAIGKLRGAALSAASVAARWTGDALSGAPTVLFDLAIVLLSWWTFATQGPASRAAILPVLLPWDRERELVGKITGEVLRGVILANIAVAAAQALIVVVSLLIFRVPSAFTLGALSFFLAFVPVFGTAPVTLGAALHLASHDRGISAACMVGVAVAVGTIDNVLRPLLMKSSADLSFFWGLVALVGGVSQFGVAGTVLGPLAFSLVVAFLEAFDFAHELPGVRLGVVSGAPSVEGATPPDDEGAAP